MTDNLEIKESAAQEVRKWVRLTSACNNRCMFCLDQDSQDGTLVPTEQIQREILEGRKQGATRLILSGGEATIHPEFLKFVALGRQVGYRWIQTITNGRVFAYRKRALLAIKAGLNEATFSMHGHTPELHDKLVGVKGAFEQAIQGMHNLLGRIVVNVDVVLNKQNVPHLREILEYYMALGITEFDLLHTVPFGLAWGENRSQLFYDPLEYNHHLKRAFELRHRPGIIMWTNRLPAAFLEGMEDLIQDPHKIHDEVRGRRDHFETWVETGSPLPCWGDRCQYCFLRGFCTRLDGRVRAIREGSGTSRVRARADLRFARGGLWPEQVKIPEKLELELVAASPEQVQPWLERFQDRLSSLEIVVDSLDQGPEAWAGVMASATRVRLGEAPLAKDITAVLPWLEYKAANPGVPELFLPTLKALTGFLKTDPCQDLGIFRKNPGIRMYVPSRELLTEAIELDMDLEEMRETARTTGWAVYRLPPCLIPGSENPSDEDEIDLTLMDENGRLDMVRYSDDYIHRGYMVKSKRCERCSLDQECRGLQITGARRFGLGSLTPQEK